MTKGLYTTHMAEKNEDSRIRALFEAGVHFGYSRGRRHPSVASSILATKNGSDIINLEHTEKSLAKALAFVAELAAAGKSILFVGSKPEAKKIIEDIALTTDQPYVTTRWIGGLLTNFSEMKKRINKLEDLREKKLTGGLDMYTKKERGLIDREMSRLNTLFGGVVGMKKLPDAMFVIDAGYEAIAATEARKSGIPVIAFSNTDVSTKHIDYPILGNDSSVSSIRHIMDEVANTFNKNKATSI